MSDQSGENPFDPTGTDLVPETPSLEDVLRLAMRSVGMGLRVCLPAQVIAVRGNQLVDVQPLLQAQYVTSATPQTLHPIPNVLVSMPMGTGWSIKYPLSIGDNGFCIFSDRSLDVWAASHGGVVDPLDGRIHDLMDAIFVPGLVPMGGQTTDETSDMVLTNGQAHVRLEKTGRFVVGNGTQELVGLIGQLADTLNGLVKVLPDAFVPSPTGGSAASTIAAAAITLQDLATSLGALKG